MNVSFDYWGTLTQTRWQKEAKALMKIHNVFLITRGKYMDKAREVAALIGIKPENVISTEGQDKGDMMNKLSIDVHYDDDANQIKAIHDTSKAYGIKIKGKRHDYSS